jgi:crotonobetaine/carnitine-CoA ligase
MVARALSDGPRVARRGRQASSICVLTGTSLSAVLRSAAEEQPDDPWLEFVDGETLTFGEVWRRATEVAAGLRERDVSPGDRVALFLENTPEFLIVWFAARLIGAIAVPMNIAARGRTLEHYLRLTTPRVVVAQDDLATLIPRALHAVSLETEIFLVGREQLPRELNELPGVHRFASLAHADAEGSFHEVAPTDAAAVLFTSGTTGVSKGVTFSERFIVHFAELAADALGFEREDVLYTCLPFFHANALILFTCGSLLVRARIVVARRFSVRAFWSDVSQHGATVTSLIGAMAALLLQRPASAAEATHRLSRIMVVPATPELHRSVAERFGVPAIDMYGMTDIGIFISNRWGEELRPGSCGRVVDGYECRIVDEWDVPVPAGSVGELLVRPTRPGFMSDGYWQMPEQTVEAWRGLWFHTGDLVRQDDDGWFYFVARQKDAIRRRGENISAYEVEDVFSAHPAVREVAAYPLKSALTEDDVALAVVLKKNCEVTAEELLRFAEDKLAYFAMPRYVTFLAKLPKTPTEKVRKQALIDMGVGEDTWDMEQVLRRR